MSNLADVCDQDNVASFVSLAFDMGSTVVRGAQAILRRVLYLWCTLVGTLHHAPGLGITTPLLDIEGATFSSQDLAGLRASLEAQALEVAFVAGCTVTLTLTASGALLIEALVTLTDNKAYALELSVSAARIVLLAIGSTS